MNATKVAIKRRYFIRSSFSVSLRNSATTFSRAEPAIVLGDQAARRWNWRTLSARRGVLVTNANRSD
jgi:hypothetical protein